MHLLSKTVDFTVAPPSAEAVRGYLQACRANARVRPALLSNPMARTNWRSVGHARLRELMPDVGDSLETPSVDALPAALNYLLFERRANVIVVNGGDGTIHHTLNAAVAAIGQAAEALGGEVPLPRFLFVRGGGMNMLARIFRSRGHPLKTVERFMKAARGAQLATLPTKGVPLLEVEEPGGTRRLGYIFGSELVFNALTMYERFGQGYRGLARFLWEVAAGHALRTELWRQYGHLLDAPDTPLIIDGARYEPYTSVVATTVPLQLVKGVIATVRRASAPGAMNVVAVLPTDKGEVIRMIPRLMAGAPHPGAIYEGGAREIVLHGPYTIDGERIDRVQGGADPRAPIKVRGTQHVVRGIWLA